MHPTIKRQPATVMFTYIACYTEIMATDGKKLSYYYKRSVLNLIYT